MADKQYLLVVALLEGRHFPRRPQRRLVVEARFDGECLSTDPVFHEQMPDINTELAWEIEKKSLRQHRLQRTPIKLQLFAVDIASTHREMVGYVMLDLRSAAQRSPSKAVWHRVLSSPYSKLKPEVKIQLTLESEEDSLAHSTSAKPFVARPAPRRYRQEAQDGSSTPLEESEEESQEESVPYQLMMNEDEGHFQLGPSQQSNQIFLLSLTIRSAANLAQLIPSNFRLPGSSYKDDQANEEGEQRGYYFLFSLVGNEIVNEPFWDLLNPDFAVEKATVRIRCNVDVIKTFLSREPDVEIQLACRGQPLGVARVPISKLVMQDRMIVEGFFPIVSPQRHSAKGEPQPLVGITLKLEVEDDAIVTAIEDDVAALASHSQPVLDAADAAALRRMETEVLTDNRQESSDSPHQHIVVMPTNRPTHTHQMQEEQQGGVTGLIQSSDHGVSVQADDILHRFCYSVDLRSVKDLDVTPVGTVAFVYLRYTYPFFGSSSPVMTSPAVEVRRHAEQRLSRGFCAFEFVTSPRQLSESLHRLPLKVEVWHRDQHSADVLIGVADVSLASVYGENKVVVEGGHRSGWRQSTAMTVPISRVEGLQQIVGELKATLALDDLGPITSSMAESLACLSGHSSGVTKDAAVSDSTVPESENGAQYISHQQRQLFGSGKMVDVRGGLEYQAALELEVWKEETEQRFLAQLKEKENKHMKALADEWKRRDKERETIFQKRVDEYSCLKEKLEKEVHELRKREQQLVLGEQQLLHQWSVLDHERDQMKQRMKDIEKRTRDTFEHQLELERLRVQELDEQKKHVQAQVVEWERRYDAKVAEFASFRELQHSKPEIQLQSEINMLNLEKVELERKVESLNKSKLHYKQQWGRALRELSVLKQQEQADARARLKKQQKELEHMRLRYLAHEEKEVMQSEKQELHDIKQELDKLRNERQPVRERDTNEDRNSKNISTNGIDSDQQRALEEAELDNRVARMIEERDTLMQTGVYSTSDRIITELDRQIRETLDLKARRT